MDHVEKLAVNITNDYYWLLDLQHVGFALYTQQIVVNVVALLTEESGCFCD